VPELPTSVMKCRIMLNRLPWSRAVSAAAAAVAAAELATRSEKDDY